MHTEKFKASVQYGDWKGTAAADDADKVDARDWLKKNGLIQEGEFLVGITFYAGENHGTHQDPLFVEFLLTSQGDHDNVKTMINSSDAPVVVRRVKAKMGVVEFVGLFKRFSVCISAHEMLNGRDYTYPDY